jgi:hypothetical protein
MIGTTLNCRGVTKKGMIVFLSDFLRDHQLDLVGLQEIIMEDYSPAFLRKIDPASKIA